MSHTVRLTGFASEEARGEVARLLSRLFPEVPAARIGAALARPQVVLSTSATVEAAQALKELLEEAGGRVLLGRREEIAMPRRGGGDPLASGSRRSRSASGEMPSTPEPFPSPVSSPGGPSPSASPHGVKEKAKATGTHRRTRFPAPPPPEEFSPPDKGGKR